ncbi:MAG: hypothetical protein ACLUD2_14205 [Clostridium sp.]
MYPKLYINSTNLLTQKQQQEIAELTTFAAIMTALTCPIRQRKKISLIFWPIFRTNILLPVWP